MHKSGTLNGICHSGSSSDSRLRIVTWIDEAEAGENQRRQKLMRQDLTRLLLCPVLENINNPNNLSHFQYNYYYSVRKHLILTMARLLSRAGKGLASQVF